MDIFIILVANLLISIGFNQFLIPHQLLAGGISGIAMLIGYFSDLHIPILYFLLNLPIIVWGFVVIGRRFIIISLLSVAITSWMMTFIPTDGFVHAPILAAVFGGVLIGTGTGLLLRIGGSSAGFDIVGSILTRHYDFPLGGVLIVLNGVVIAALGYFKDNWDLALYSMLAIYITGVVVDMLHIKHVKVTAFIVTSKKEQMLEKMLRTPRGVTILKAEGAYSSMPSDVLMTVITRYELVELKRIVESVDEDAFVNIVETAGIWGKFNRLS
ncbi:YitT family protein [Paenibacillus sp. N1-5-1-14]|uniref:YitT family protein n=1 Tax=Paenibacillus radicibacter TaxID=2972488 RepID=UPI002158F38C|nr:YitT family protein [Paenibacillus radicibacter]MCR8643892.1 YitT family protein [Paenibacillus radicibacter]